VLPPGVVVAPPTLDDAELANDPRPRQRHVGDERQALAGEVVDDREDAEAAAVGEGVRQKAEAPALVRPLRERDAKSSSYKWSDHGRDFMRSKTLTQIQVSHLRRTRNKPKVTKIQHQLPFA
jgi:hypothetical protein